MCYLCAAAAAATAAAAPVGSAPAAAPMNFIVAKFVRPVLFSFAGVNVYSYGAFVGAALVIALMVFAEDLKRAGIDLDELSCFFVFLVGFAGGSKAHVAASAFGAGEELSWKALDIRTGHSFIGSQIGAVICLLIYVRYRRVGVLPFLDVLLPCCLVGHCVGKLGCFFSGDGCYGPPANPEQVPWAMSLPNAAVPTRVPVHPTPLYEMACSLMVSLLARVWQPLPAARAGRRTAAVLVLYGIERVILENYRQHPPIHVFGGMTEYQFIAVVLFLIGASIDTHARWTASPPGPSSDQKTPQVTAKKTKKA